MNKNIFNPRVQQFLSEHLKADVHKVALKKSPFEDVSSRELAEQLDSKQRAEKKLPLWFNTPGILFPPKLSLEQSSSELTAQYKSILVKGEKLIDLTGGFGVDAFFFSKVTKEVIHCEQNAELSQLVAHNLQLLGADNIRYINTDSIEYLRNTEERFDTIYIDPSRRIQTKKVFLLKDTEPDVVKNLPLLLSKASRIIIKTSPLFDIQSGLKELQHVSAIHVVSVKN
ncbi:MAG: RsmD family RNA methyltransferase, partial [Sphingobacteriaceae bacterium]